MKSIMVGLLSLVCALSALASETENDVRAMLKAQSDAWNKGDVRGFMSYYWHSDKLRFGSGNTITYGFSPTEKRFLERYNTPEKMGRLDYEILEVNVFDQSHVQIFGRWSLQRKDDHPNGLLTLNLEKIDGKWQIVSDHTSSE